MRLCERYNCSLENCEHRMSNTEITVLIATRNRQNLLSRTLKAYCRLERPAHDWKVVIVDNGSTDLTATILAAFEKRLPLETLWEPIPGKNRALNCGLAAIEGRLVVLTDDDAIPERSFLVAWSKYLHQNLECELFGGSIDPLFEAPLPKWMLKNKPTFEIQFAARDLPQGPVEAESIFGTNMAVRISVFERGFKFCEHIGPNKSDPNYGMGSETEFCRRVAQSGAKLWFAKQPRVQHIVTSNQLSTSYYAKRAYRYGRGLAQQTTEGRQALPSNLLRPLMMDHLWSIYHRLRMYSPFPLQRFHSLFAYNLKRGFCDEWARRKAEMSRSHF